MTGGRNTKIMATLSGLRATADFVAGLRDSGADAVRINSAHASLQSLSSQVVELVRAVAPGMGILMDTKGPELRTTFSETPVDLREGRIIEISSSPDGALPTTGRRIYVAASDLHRYVSSGSHILFDDGVIAAEVASVDETGVMTARVVRGGSLGSCKTVALDSGLLPPLPAVSDRDRVFIREAVRSGIDMIAHSFVRSASDVASVRELIAGSSIRIYAKIECRQAIDNLEEIIGAADGILVARGDLGTALPLSEIPAVQYDILRCCRAAGKPVIVSTQMLHSMIDNPMPTRAEVSDIAMAVMEGADMLLLCGETAEGRYPLECVRMMRDTIVFTERAGLRNKIIS